MVKLKSEEVQTTYELIMDDEQMPRRELRMTREEFEAFSKAGDALAKANEQRFDGTPERNLEIAFGSAMAFAKVTGNISPEKLKPKFDNEPLQVIAVRLRENCEVYYVWQNLGSSCDRVQMGDSKTLDLYGAFESPSWGVLPVVGD
jgi:hypothetical protein